MPRLQLRDIIVYYEETGSGDPLLLITGLGSDLQSWALTAPALAKHFRVITFDNRGAGRSSAPDRPYSVEQMADDAAALLEGLGIQKAHVLGVSLGGMIAQELALRHAGLVNKLILVSSAPAVDGYLDSIIRGLYTVRRTNISREGFVRVMAPLIYSRDFLNEPGRLDSAVQNSIDNPYPQQDHAYLRQVQAMLRYDSESRLKDIKAETLVIHGDEDILVPPYNAEKLSSGIPNAKLTMLPGGHVGLLEHSSTYNEALLEFLGVAAATAS